MKSCVKLNFYFLDFFFLIFDSSLSNLRLLCSISLFINKLSALLPVIASAISSADFNDKLIALPEYPDEKLEICIGFD